MDEERYHLSACSHLRTLTIDSRSPAKSHERTQYTRGRILVNDPIAKCAPAHGAPIEIAIAIERDSAHWEHAVRGYRVAVETHQCRKHPVLVEYFQTVPQQ